jgi:hypothetical protein
MSNEHENVESNQTTCLLAELDSDLTTKEKQTDAKQTWDDDMTIEFDIPVQDLTTEEVKVVKAVPSSVQIEICLLGCCAISEHEIHTDTEKPIYQHPYRKSLSKRSKYRRRWKKCCPQMSSDHQKAHGRHQLFSLRSRTGGLSFALTIKHSTPSPPRQNRDAEDRWHIRPIGGFNLV